MIKMSGYKPKNRKKKLKDKNKDDIVSLSDNMRMVLQILKKCGLISVESNGEGKKRAKPNEEHCMSLANIFDQLDTIPKTLLEKPQYED